MLIATETNLVLFKSVMSLQSIVKIGFGFIIIIIQPWPFVLTAFTLYHFQSTYIVLMWANFQMLRKVTTFIYLLVWFGK